MMRALYQAWQGSDEAVYVGVPLSISFVAILLAMAVVARWTGQ